LTHEVVKEVPRIQTIEAVTEVAKIDTQQREKVVDTIQTKVQQHEQVVPQHLVHEKYVEVAEPVNVIVNRDVAVENHQIEQVHVNTQSSISQTHQRPQVHENHQIVTGTATVAAPVVTTAPTTRIIGGGIIGGGIAGSTVISSPRYV